jgi:gluconate kinase
LDAQLASFEEFGTDEPVIHIDTSQDMAEDITRVAKWMISPS